LSQPAGKVDQVGRFAQQLGELSRVREDAWGSTMNWLLIFILLSLCLWLIMKGLSRPGGIYEYPFLAGATFLGFALPQMPALANDPFLPPDAFAKTAFVTILCVAACSLGWVAGKRPMPGLNWSFDERRLEWLAVFLSFTGAFFYFKISRLPPEMTEGLWTGVPVMYWFFARYLTYGFALAVLCFARRPSSFMLGIILFDSMFFMDRILIGGRRGDTADFILIIALAAWFYRKIAIPRALVVIGFVAGALVISSIGDYRSASTSRDGPSWSEVSRIDWIGNFQDLLENGGLEMRNAVMIIAETDRLKNFDYGLFHWNILVFNFVPAQLFGSDFKESFMVPLDSKYPLGYINPPGATETGMADAFASFWYFGALKFFVIAYLLGRIYRSAGGGDTICQLLYMLALTPAMLAITHHTQWVISNWVQIGLLFFPFLALVRVKTSAIVSARGSPPKPGRARPLPLACPDPPGEPCASMHSVNSGSRSLDL
jgi:hypothetical protein